MEQPTQTELESSAEEEVFFTEEEVLVWEWRAEQLERLGLSRLIAEAFAHTVDWHEMARLVGRGCPPRLALEIVR
jgi:hypothetical protein